MLRHVIAPARLFSQVPNEIIRHPRLSSDAVRLLTWQLSLPQGAEQPLYRTAERAGIKKTAFQRAKRELREEGYFHEWRHQAGSGHWVTTQLVSNVPLTAEEATTACSGRQVETSVNEATAPTPAPLSASAATSVTQPGTAPTAPPPVPFPATATPGPISSWAPIPPPSPSPGVLIGAAVPSAVRSTVGEPTGRPLGGQPRKEPTENTSHPPAGPPQSVAAADTGTGIGAGTDTGTSKGAAEAEQLLLSLGRTAPALLMSQRKARSWAPLALPWLALGLDPGQLRHTLTQGLDTARSPLGALHWRLQHALPETAASARMSPDHSVPAAPPSRVSLMRECAGSHVQPRLFLPPADAPDEAHCPDCRTTPDESRQQASPNAGLQTFRASRTVNGRPGPMSRPHTRTA